ncbi:hypothetical protein [Anabaena azotica]|uniref:Knr4/Smi1-like domain-containing protein n=1 Tax=Anabaena azotica FACHB-119 TaxID=947527 RepID=A0ABR8D2E1_9NOST|nr:hypothetical protein [Anabaena azotica]MBD2501106.1 hypothetical protein [Anabaena azotica FACHB-119]
MKQHNIHSLIDCLRTMGELYTDYGPKHPIAANITLQPILEEVYKLYPFIQKDTYYTEFLECYGGLSYSQQTDLLSLDVFGISNEISTHLLYDPGEAISSDGVLTFCSIALVRDLNNPRPDKMQGLGFGFEATGKRIWGVYRCFDSEPYHYYCNNFLELLEHFVNTNGRLIEKST